MIYLIFMQYMRDKRSVLHNMVLQQSYKVYASMTSPLSELRKWQ